MKLSPNCVTKNNGTPPFLKLLKLKTISVNRRQYQCTVVQNLFVANAPRGDIKSPGHNIVKLNILVGTIFLFYTIKRKKLLIFKH